MEWEILCALDIVILANQVSPTLDVTSKAGYQNTWFLTVENEGLWTKQNFFLVSAIIAKSQDIEKEIITNLSSLGTFSPLTSFSIVLPVLNDKAPRNYTGSSQSF